MTVGVGVTVGVTVDVGVCVGVLVAVGVGVFVGVTVRVGVVVGVDVGVGVRVAVDVNVAVRVGVGVLVGVGVRVGVGVGARTDRDAAAEACCLTAVMETLVVGAVSGVETVNVAVAVPAATVTLEGTVAAAVLELARYTISPPAGAGPLRVTVPVEVVPPTTVVGLSDTLEGRIDVVVRTAVFVAPETAVTVVSRSSATATVVAENVANSSASRSPRLSEPGR
ncbi:MAG TPA: hypothetical protein PLB01_05000 [Thermoanaerobaculia bacterium]|nr:hypothetical protein [Thermoanaerobaculia bacterium]